NGPVHQIDLFGLDEVQCSIGINGTAGGWGFTGAGFFLPGPYVGGQAVVGFTSSGSLFLQLQANTMAGGGYFFGGGLIGGVGWSENPIPPGKTVTTTFHAEANIGAGDAVGASLDIGPADVSGNFPIPGVNVKFLDSGIGAMAAPGVAKNL